MDRIKVFISSAMRKELDGTLDWNAVRREVANAVNACSVFEAFAIEEHASPEPSTQYMLSQVNENDVYVLLLGESLRPGTEQEYQKACELHKPMLVYVVDVCHDSKCKACLDELQREDRCTYRTIRGVENLGDSVLGDLLEHLVRHYKGLSYAHPVEENDMLRGSVEAYPFSMLDRF